MKLIPYLNFNGRCSEALRFYEKALGGKTVCEMTFAESPMADKTPDEWKKKVMHARFETEGNVIMASDGHCGQAEKPQGINLALNFEDPAKAEKIFHALAEKGSVTMPIQETFWAQRFGMLADQFGIPWMINCEKRQ